MSEDRDPLQDQDDRLAKTAQEVGKSLRDINFTELENRIRAMMSDMRVPPLTSFPVVSDNEPRAAAELRGPGRPSGTPAKKGKILRQYVKDGRVYTLHATKGWRSRALR